MASENHFEQKRGSAQEGAQQFLRRVAYEMEEGAFDAAVKQRSRLLACIEGDELAAMDRVEAQIRFCRLALPWLDLESVARALRPFVREYRDGQLRLDEPELEALTRLDAMLAGLLYAEIANALFRCLQHDESERWAERALLLLSPPHAACPGFSKLSVTVSAVLAHAWRSRPRWQKARPGSGASRQDIVDGLREQLALLEALAGEHREKPSSLVNQAYAILCDLTGDFEYSSGRISAAEDLAQRALIVLGDGVSDSARSGHLFYLLGKIQGGRVDQNRYDFAVRLFQRAHEAYTRLSPAHPFRYRCEVHEIRCLIREDRLDEASDRLNAARNELRSSPGGGPDLLFNLFHVDITELWILERRARAGGLSWSAALEHVRQLAPRAHSMGLRLRSETYLHLGLALGHTGAIEEARSALSDSRQFGIDGGQPSLETAADLALAEVLASSDRQAAEDYLARARRGLRSRVRSAYLTRWYQRLEAMLELPLTFEVRTDATYRDAERNLRTVYLRYHAHVVGRSDGKLAQLSDRTGIPRSTLLRWMEEIGEADLLTTLGLLAPRK